MSILSPSNLETTTYGLQGWNAVHSANMQRLNDKIGEMMDNANGSVAGTQSVTSPVDLYGEMYGGVENILISPASTWVKYSVTVAGELSGAGYITHDAANDRLIVGANGGGNYEVMASFIVSPDVACNVSGAIYVNGTEVAKITKVFTMSSGEEREMVLTGNLGSLVDTDYVELFVMSDVNNTTITVDTVNIAIKSSGRILSQLNALLVELRKTTGCGVLAG